MILGAFYLLWMLQRVIFGPLVEPRSHGHGNTTDPSSSPHCRPVGWHEILGLAPLMVSIVLIGVFPGPLFDRIRPAVAPIAAQLRDLEEAASKRVGLDKANPESLTQVDAATKGRR
jgi:NADH-quinone oxidoreductase subunit M